MCLISALNWFIDFFPLCFESYINRGWFAQIPARCYCYFSSTQFMALYANHLASSLTYDRGMTCAMSRTRCPMYRHAPVAQAVAPTCYTYIHTHAYDDAPTLIYVSMTTTRLSYLASRFEQVGNARPELNNEKSCKNPCGHRNCSIFFKFGL